MGNVKSVKGSILSKAFAFGICAGIKWISLSGTSRYASYFQYKIAPHIEIILFSCITDEVH